MVDSHFPRAAVSEALVCLVTAFSSGGNKAPYWDNAISEGGGNSVYPSFLVCLSISSNLFVLRSHCQGDMVD